MGARSLQIGRGLVVGSDRALTVIAGPCVLESLELGLAIGSAVRDACASLGLQYVFKASFDKANRTSIGAPRGPGIERGLGWLARIARELDVPTTTDVHSPEQCAAAAEVVDLLQIPAFLCRQTDLLLAAGAAAAKHERAVNVKKGQFVSPAEMVGPVRKLAEAGCARAMLTERGTFFGYGRLVNDFVGVGDLLELSVDGVTPAVCFDCTHSTQQPGGAVDAAGRMQSGGRPERAPLLARCAVAAGVDAVFLECHPTPRQAMSDGATMLPMSTVPALLADLAAIRRARAPQR